MKNTLSALRNDFGRNNRPNETTVDRLVRKFYGLYHTTGSLADFSKSVGSRSVGTRENIAPVKQSVKDNPPQHVDHLTWAFQESV